jgi:hypothetical protein
VIVWSPAVESFYVFEKPIVAGHELLSACVRTESPLKGTSSGGWTCARFPKGLCARVWLDTDICTGPLATEWRDGVDLGAALLADKDAATARLRAFGASCPMVGPRDGTLRLTVVSDVIADGYEFPSRVFMDVDLVDTSCLAVWWDQLLSVALSGAAVALNGATGGPRAWMELKHMDEPPIFSTDEGAEDLTAIVVQIEM